MAVSNYRADIDGLRAIAVLCALFYHVEWKLFEGGFVGVGVFFIISGFLITRLIRDEILETGQFKFRKFYVRRARRLLPAFFFTLLVSFTLAFLLFSPQLMQRFGGALFHSVISISNIYFWGESSYFDASSSLKPLLHTWTLSVEEQFYLIWPLLLVILFFKVPRFMVLPILVGIGVCSISLNIDFFGGNSTFLSMWFPSLLSIFSDGPTSTFYLAPFRVYEFVLGAIMVWMVQYQPKRKWLLEPLVPLGLLLIGYSAMTFDKQTVYSLNKALIPCIGALLVIYGGTAKFTGRLLNNKPMVGIGLMSYSLYLIHWPIIVFFKYAGDPQLQQDRFDVQWPMWEPVLTGTQQLVLCIISVFVAYLMFKWIETPFRRMPGKDQEGSAEKLAKKPNSKLFISCMLCCTFVFGVLGFKIWTSDGWTFRSHAISQDLQDFIKFGGGEGQFHTLNYGGVNAKNHIISKDHPTIVLVGDSHGRMYYAGAMAMYGKTHNIVIVNRLFGYKQEFEDWAEDIEPLKALKHKTIIIAHRWTFYKYANVFFGQPQVSPEQLKEHFTAQVDEFLKQLLLNNSDRVFVFGQVPQIVGHQGLIDCLLRPSWFKVNKCSEMDIDKAPALQFREILNGLFEDYIHTNKFSRKVEYFNPYEVLCPGRVCKQIMDDKLIYSDEDHLSIYGSKIVFERLPL